MKLIYTLFMATLIALVVYLTMGCNNEQIVSPQKELTVRDAPDVGKIKIIDANGVTHSCDSTWDKKIQGVWIKTGWRNGEVLIQYPYDWNEKGFTTKLQ